jgi:hypothetical protein
MGRRRIRQPDFRKSLLTEELLLRALCKYSTPIPIDSIIRQMLHLEPQLGQDRSIYKETVTRMVEGLSESGRIMKDVVFPDVFLYWLGPLERLALS